MAATKRWVPVTATGEIDKRFEKDARMARRRSRLSVIVKRVDGPAPPKPTIKRAGSQPTKSVNKRIGKLESKLAEVAADLGVDLDRRERVLRGRDLSARGGVIICERADGTEQTIDLGPDKAGDQAVRRLEIPKERREHVARF